MQKLPFISHAKLHDMKIETSQLFMWNCLFRSTNEIADDQNDQNKINVSITDLNGKGSHIAPEVVEEMKSKFQKHQQILVSNYEQAESEIKRMDEIYHDTISNVLNVRLLNILFNLIKHFTILLFFRLSKNFPWTFKTSLNWKTCEKIWKERPVKVSPTWTCLQDLD